MANIMDSPMHAPSTHTPIGTWIVENVKFIGGTQSTRSIPVSYEAGR